MPKMKAALFVSPHQIRVEEVEIPSPGPGEVIVKVECCGICGTDYHILEGDFISPYPIAGGHEFCPAPFMKWGRASTNGRRGNGSPSIRPFTAARASIAGTIAGITASAGMRSG